MRHNHSYPAGEAGLFFSHKIVRYKQIKYQFFTKLTFNAVTGDADYREMLPEEFRPKGPFRPNVVGLRPHLRVLQENREPGEGRFAGSMGLPFRAIGVNNGHWFDIELTVQPSGITIRVDGRTMTVTAKEFEEGLAKGFEARSAKLDSDTSKSLAEYRGQGGLGLYIEKGSASFQSVSVTPL